MKKVVFIIPYYGKLPCYFPAWLKSAQVQKDIDFLFVTDLIREQPSPNIKILFQSFDETQKLFQSKFNFKIALNKAYKFCDFRPAYGYIFSEYIKDYDFWGHFDIDTVLGNLSKYLDPLMEKFDAIGRWGHLSLYRNTDFMNQLFMSNKGLFSYKEVFSSDYNYAFDETAGMKTICERTSEVSYQWYFEDMADIITAYHNITIGKYAKNHEQQCFIFENGKLIQCYIDNRKINYKELMYLHFQKKNPTCSENIASADSFYIFGDSFIIRRSSETDAKAIEKNHESSLQKKSEYVLWVLRKSFNELKQPRKQREILRSKRKVGL